MKKAIFLCAFVAISTLMCPPSVLAQSAGASTKKSDLAISFVQLKSWIFSARSNSTIMAKSAGRSDSEAECGTICQTPPFCYGVHGEPIYVEELCKGACGRDCGKPEGGILKP
jgi:hypothetical protein